LFSTKESTMTTILILNGISSVLAALGLGGIFLRARVRARGRAQPRLALLSRGHNGRPAR
jgi:hypothetical protein